MLFQKITYPLRNLDAQFCLFLYFVCHYNPKIVQTSPMIIVKNTTPQTAKSSP
jgi:hypothetical protein